MLTITSRRFYLVVIIVILFLPSILQSAAYTVRGSGNWNGTTTWRRNGTNTATPPTIADDVTLGGTADRTVTIPANFNAVCLSLTFAADANTTILTMNDGSTLTVAGDVIFNSPNANNHNKTWNINAASATVNGNITLNEGTDDTQICRINITSGTLDVAGSISFANITSDTRTAINITGAGNIYIAGDLTSTGSYGTLAPGTSGTVTFDGTNDQTISLVGGMLFNNVVVNKSSGTATFSILSGPYFEAEDATMSGAVFANNHPGYSGTGFADYINPTGDYVEWTINTGNAVTTELIFRYALDTTDRSLELMVNGAVADDSLTFTRLGPEWTNYSVLNSNPVNLIAGANIIRLTATGESGPNLDYLAVIPLNSAVTGNFSVLQGTAVIANSFMVYGNLTVNGTLNLSTFSMNGNSSGKVLTLGSTGILQVGGTTGGATGSNFPTGYNGTPSVNSASRVLYNGAGTQTIAHTVTYGILEVNNAAGVNLTNGSVTASALTMTAGNMTTGANMVTVTSPLAGSRSGNGLIIGSIRHLHAFTQGTTYYFEGPNTYIIFTGLTTTPNSVTVTSYPNTLIPAGNSANAIRRYYTIVTDGGSGLTATLQLHYDATTELNGLNEATFSAWRYSGSVWEDQGGTRGGAGTANAWVQRTGLTNITNNYWTVTNSNSPLPVQLTSLTASAKKFDITLEWKTASEKNNYGFDIERKSADGEWTKVGFVGGHGTTTIPQEYMYTDRNAPPGTLSFRLKQTDFDGKFEYCSAVEVVSGATEKSFMLGQNYPSPFNPVTTIEFSIPDDSPTMLKVYNTLGQEVATLVDGQSLSSGLIHRVTFDGSRHSSGTYYYVLKSGKFSAVKKMILLK